MFAFLPKLTKPFSETILRLTCRLLQDYKRLITPLQGVIQIKQGPDYHVVSSVRT